jgi:hypothetical protein
VYTARPDGAGDGTQATLGLIIPATSCLPTGSCVL